MGIYPTIGERIFIILYLLFLFSLDLQSFFKSSKILQHIFKFSQKTSISSSDFSLTHMAEEEIQVEEGLVPALKWDQGLFEQLVRGFQFLAEWDARYPQQGQTAVDAPPGYITLLADFFFEGNFHFPATHFMAMILTFMVSIFCR
ncbi:hypothetical protein Hanom_Chr16g01422621 [Helianthus anomalus]